MRRDKQTASTTHGKLQLYKQESTKTACVNISSLAVVSRLGSCWVSGERKRDQERRADLPAITAMMTRWRWWERSTRLFLLVTLTRIAESRNAWMSRENGKIKWTCENSWVRHGASALSFPCDQNNAPVECRRASTLFRDIPSNLTVMLTTTESSPSLSVSLSLWLMH